MAQRNETAAIPIGNANNPNNPSATSPPRAEVLLRRENSSANQIALKEKFVAVYEAFFNGEDPSKGKPSFWEEVLLLKVNSSYLERCIILSAEDKLVSLKGNISNIFINCTKGLSESYAVRQLHSLETLSVLMRSIFRKRFNNFGDDVANILCGSVDKADVIFKELLTSVQNIFENQQDLDLQTTAIQMILIILTAVDNISQNTLFEYFLKVDLFPTFCKVLEKSTSGGPSALALSSSTGVATSSSSTTPPPSSPVLSIEYSFKILLILVILANYQKNEATNIYRHHLQNIDQPSVLKAFASILSEVYSQINKNSPPTLDPVNAGVWSRFGSYVSSFVYKQPDPSSQSGNSAGPCLLVHYELAYSNPNFAKWQVPALSRSSSTTRNPSPRGSKGPSTPNLTPVEASPVKQPAATTSVMQHFLTFCTHVFADCSDARNNSHSKILTCLSESTYLEDSFHDPVSTGSFTYAKSTEPADKATAISNVQPQAGQGLACVILDALNLLMKQNFKKNFEADLYGKCINVVHRILSYEKKTATRLNYKWKDMWNTLFTVMKQAMGTGEGMTKQQLVLCMQVVTVLNLFITYGDSFLPSPSDYDDLYYEIMRVSKMLEQFYLIADKHEHSDGAPTPIPPPIPDPLGASSGVPVGASSATLSMLNIKTIISHFSGKIQQWNFAHPEATLTPDMVLRIIKDNYDTLKLKLQENLDYYDDIETTETPFFRQYTRSIIGELKTSTS